MTPPASAPTTDTSRRAQAKGRNIIAVASGKGGVGKTWFSSTLSHALSNKGRKVLLFDADLGLANVDIQLGLMPQRDLGGVISGRLKLPQAKVRFDEGGFDIIAGRSGAGNLATLPPNRLAALGMDIVNLSNDYDHLIMDMGAGVDRTVRILSGRAGRVIVVTTAEPTSLTDAYAFIKVTVQNDPGADIRVVVNNADSAGKGLATYDTLSKACKNFLNFAPPLLGVIRSDRKVLEAIRAQVPLLTRSPGSNAAMDIDKVSNNLLDDA